MGSGFQFARPAEFDAPDEELNVREGILAGGVVHVYRGVDVGCAAAVVSIRRRIRSHRDARRGSGRLGGAG